MIGLDGTKFWNLQNFELIIFFKDALYFSNNALKKIYNDRIIVG